MSANTASIYVLKDPETGDIRYVGKTKDPKQRLFSHLANCRRCQNHRAYWIRSLAAKNQRPIFEVIDEVRESEWPQWEVAWIAFFREQGCDLTNATYGGEGMCNPSVETRAKLSLAKRGVPQTDAVKANKSARMRGNTLWVGRKHSEETKEKMRLSASKRRLVNVVN